MQRPWLLPFVPFYAICAGLYHTLFDLGFRKPRVVNIPVISIGNITLGGTGKTPFACWLLMQLKEMGIRPVYLSRGYGRHTTGSRKVNPDVDTVETCGDEALMVALSLPEIPVWVGEDRVSAAQMIISRGNVDVIVLDDAFQHRKIYRDLDIVLLDATRMPEADTLFPAGNLREATRSLKRAGLVVVNRVPKIFDTHIFESLPNNIPHAACRNIPGKAVPVNKSSAGLANRSVAALAGLGNNRQYFDQLKSQYQVALELPYADHHLYSDSDIVGIVRAVHNAGISDIVTTTKDLMRLKRHIAAFEAARLQVWETPVTFEWVYGLEEMGNALHRIFPNLPLKSYL